MPLKKIKMTQQQLETLIDKEAFIKKLHLCYMLS